MKLGKILTNIPIYLYAIGFLLITPLVYSKMTIEPLLSIRLLYISLLTILITIIYILYYKKLNIGFYRSPLFLTLAGFILFSGISYFFAYNRVEALSIICKYFTYFMFPYQRIIHSKYQMIRLR